MEPGRIESSPTTPWGRGGGGVVASGCGGVGCGGADGSWVFGMPYPTC